MDRAASLLPYAMQGEQLAAFVGEHAHADRLLSGDNKFWRYRTYEGGEPVTMIDWHQSARVDTLLIREKEKGLIPCIRFWNGCGPTKQAAIAPLILALAYLALDHGATIGWLSEDLTTFRGRSRMDSFASHSVHQLHTSPPSLLPLQKRNILLCASPFDEGSPQAWQDYMNALAAQEVTCLFFRVGENTALSQHIDQLCRKHGWIYFAHNATKKAEETLLLLLEGIIRCAQV